MNKSNLILLVTLILSFSQIQAQEESKSNFNIIMYGGIGYGKVVNNLEPNYNLNSNKGEILLNYNVGKDFGLATGIGINHLSGNGFDSNGNFYHERTTIKIPLLFTVGVGIAEKFKMIGNLGFYSKNILNDNYRYLLVTQENNYDGWNFGFQAGVGFVYEFIEQISFGFHYNLETDFTKIENKDSLIVNDEQKIINLNSIGIILIYNL